MVTQTLIRPTLDPQPCQHKHVHTPEPFYNGFKELGETLKITDSLHRTEQDYRENRLSYRSSFSLSLSHALLFSVKAHQTQKIELVPCSTAVKADIRIPYISSEVDTILINFL